MYDELKALDEFEAEDFDLGVPGEQEGYMSAEGPSFEAGDFEGGGGLDQFAGGQDSWSADSWSAEADPFGDFEALGSGEGSYEGRATRSSARSSAPPRRSASWWRRSPRGSRRRSAR